MALEKILINKLPGKFQDLNMHLEFLLLNRRVQVWIARVKLSLLIKNLSLGWMVRRAIADEIESIFEDTQQNIEVQLDF